MATAIIDEESEAKQIRTAVADVAGELEGNIGDLKAFIELIGTCIDHVNIKDAEGMLHETGNVLSLCVALNGVVKKLEEDMAVVYDIGFNRPKRQELAQAIDFEARR